MSTLIVTGHLTDPKNVLGGVVKSFPSFVGELREEHPNVSVMGIVEQGSSLSSTFEDIDVVALPSKDRNKHSFTLKFLSVFKAVRSSSFVVLNGYHNFLLTLSLIFVMVLNRPFSVHFRGGLEKTRLKHGRQFHKKVWNFLFLGYLLRNSKSIYCSTERERDDIIDLVKDGSLGDKFIVVSNRTNTQFTHKKTDHLVSHKALLFFGRVSKQKGVFRLIESVSSLDGVSLSFVGPIEPSDEARFLSLVDETPSVSYRSSMEVADIAREFSNSVDAYISASTSENFGNVFLEATAMHLPIISTKVGVLESLVEDEDFFLISDGSDPAAIAAVIRRFYASPASVRAKMVESSAMKFGLL